MTVHPTTKTGIIRKDTESHTFYVDTAGFTARTNEEYATEAPEEIRENIHRETTITLKNEYGSGNYPVRHIDVRPRKVIGYVTWDPEAPSETMSVDLRDPCMAWLDHSRVDSLIA